MSVNIKRLEKLGVAALKKRLWKEFALYIKLSHSQDGRFCNCFTCGKRIEIGKLECHAGHYLNKKSYSFHYFTEDNVRPQCSYCNTFREGMTACFRINLVKDLGLDRVEELEATRHALEKRSRSWYVDKIVHYAAEVERLR